MIANKTRGTIGKYSPVARTAHRRQGAPNYKLLWKFRSDISYRNSAINIVHFRPAGRTDGAGIYEYNVREILGARL